MSLAKYAMHYMAIENTLNIKRLCPVSSSYTGVILGIFCKKQITNSYCHGSIHLHYCGQLMLIITIVSQLFNLSPVAPDIMLCPTAY